MIRVGESNGILEFELLLQFLMLKPLNSVNQAQGGSWTTPIGLLCKRIGLSDSIAAESAP